MQEEKNNLVTIVIGGVAGAGAREAGNNIAKVLAKIGFESFVSADYPSLIRGGHNFSRITFSNEKVYNDHTQIDILIALDGKTIELHMDEMKEEGIVIADNFTQKEMNILGERAVSLSMNDIVRELDAPHIARTSIAIGALSFILDIPLENVKELFGEVFKDKMPDTNIKLAQRGHADAEAAGLKHNHNLEIKGEPKTMLNASQTFSEGLVKAGLDFYVAYPMTPASPILHYLAKKQKEFNIKVIHPENELSVMNMALGIAYSGKRTAIGTAGGGFALMHESFSLAGISETPLVVAIAQRQAPASGVPTYTSQGDMLNVVFSGHGEFPRIVIAPGDPEEAYYCGGDSLNLAWKYQIPVIALFDKHTTESLVSGAYDKERVIKGECKIAENPGGDYKRYQVTEDGISPIAFPGTPGVLVKATSYEHGEDGITTEEADKIKIMQDKRFLKLDAIKKDMSNYETVKIYGDKNSKKVVIFWGSTKGAVLEAAKYIKEDAKLVQIVWLEPLDEDRLQAELGDAELIINVEGNHDAQLSTLIRARTGIKTDKNIIRYDARPFEPMKLAEELKKLLS